LEVPREIEFSAVDVGGAVVETRVDCTAVSGSAMSSRTGGGTTDVDEPISVEAVVTSLLAVVTIEGPSKSVAVPAALLIVSLALVDVNHEDTVPKTKSLSFSLNLIRLRC